MNVGLNGSSALQFVLANKKAGKGEYGIAKERFLVRDLSLDVLYNETSVELVKILVKESHQSNNVYPEPPFTRT